MYLFKENPKSIDFSVVLIFEADMEAVFSFAIVLVAVDNIFGQQTTFNCSRKPLFTPLDVKICCKLPKITLTDYRDGCYTKSFNGGINKPIDDNSFMNPCAVECVYKRAGAISNNNELNMLNMKALIIKNIGNDSEFIDVLYLGFEKCNPEILDKLQEFEENRTKIAIGKNKGHPGQKLPCSPFAFLVSICALRHAFINCPKNSWIKTEVCNNALNYVKLCGPAKFRGPRHRHNGKIKIKT